MYQPRWIDGKTVGAGERNAVTRYEAISRRLHDRQEFSVLDVGAYAGYFSLRLADEHQARVVAWDDRPELRGELRRAQNPWVAGVFRRMTEEDAKNLPSYDVILCLSVLHHVPWWPVMLRELRRSADLLFVETPDAREHLPSAVAHSAELHEAVAALGGEWLCEVPGYDSRYQRALYAVQGE